MVPKRSALAGSAAALVVLGGLTACTSSEDGNGSTGGPSASGSPTSAAPTSGTTSGLARIDDAYLVVGRTPAAADVYRVADGRLQRITTNARVTTVTAADDQVVIGREVGGRDVVQQVRNGRPTSIGIPAGFSPALSDDGELAWVTLDGPGTTPGVTKPRGFTVHVRASLSADDRSAATFTSSVGGLQWTDGGLVAAVAVGDRARLQRVGGAARTFATVADGADLDVTAGEDAFTVSSSDGYVVVTTDGAQRPFVAGWTPLCWPEDDEVLAAKAGRLATVAIDGSGRPGSPRVLGSLPAGTSAYGGSCD